MKSKLISKYLYIWQICFIIIISIPFCNNYIIFPIKIKNKLNQVSDENIYSPSRFIDLIKNNQVSTNFNIGTPPKKIEIYLTSERLDFILGEGFCDTNPDSDYNSSLSTSFEKSQLRHFSPAFINGFISNENIILYNNFSLSTNISYPNICFINCNPSTELFDVINNNSICGYIGLQVSSSSEYFEWTSVIYQLKSKNLIDNQKWSIIFCENIVNNYDGVFVLGIKEEEYNNIFNLGYDINNDYKTIYSLNTFSNSDYEINFDEIYYEMNNQNYSFQKFIKGIFIIDYDYIISNEDYFNSIKNNFFNSYIEKGICFIDKQKKYLKTTKSNMQLLNIIFCEKDKIEINELKKFPILYLKHIGLEQIFEFGFEELFLETKNYFIFKILLNEENKRFWYFGRLFLKKYQMIFDNDQKAIFYLGINDPHKKSKIGEDNQNNNNSFKYKIYLIIILAIIIIGIAVAIGCYFGKIFFNKQKKKRANELDDDYEYIEKKNNLNQGIGIKFDDND